MRFRRPDVRDLRRGTGEAAGAGQVAAVLPGLLPGSAGEAEEAVEAVFVVWAAVVDVAAVVAGRSDHVSAVPAAATRGVTV